MVVTYFFQLTDGLPLNDWVGLSTHSNLPWEISPVLPPMLKRIITTPRIVSRDVMIQVNKRVTTVNTRLKNYSKYSKCILSSTGSFTVWL